MMKRTALYEQHIKLNAKMVEFAGYEMPVQYSTIKEEHHAVRHKAGVFDVSHMGEIRVVGPEATEFMDYVFTNTVHSARANQVVYGFLTQDDGGVVDDFLAYKINERNYWLVVNAANKDKDYAWLLKHAANFDVEIIDESNRYSEIALQGPLAEAMLQTHTTYDLSSMKPFTFDEITLDDVGFTVSRTGYTGEDGFEIYGNHDDVKLLFKHLLVDHDDLIPCGLGARDTLRYEVALPLYGHEISETITPLEAGYKFAVDFNKPSFIGREALIKQKEVGLTRRIVGLEIKDKGIARDGAEVFKDETKIGHVTTGYMSPSMGKALALALIDKPYDKRGTAVSIKVRKRMLEAEVIKKKLLQK